MTDDKMRRHTLRIDYDNWLKLLELRAELSKQSGHNVSMKVIINDAIRAYQLPDNGRRFIE